MASLLACGGDPQPFEIKLRLTQGPLYGCLSTDCVDYGMSCGALLSVRLIDADDFGSEEPRIYGEACTVISDAEDLCAIGDLDLSFPEIPADRTIQVQVAVWEPPADNQPVACPENVFDLQGIPLDRTPQPAFGGVGYLEAGSAEMVEIFLACRQPELVDKAACLSTNRVTVRLDDMQALVPVRLEDAPSLGVAVGEPQLETEVDPPEWVIRPTNTFQMELVQPSPIPPVWNRNDVPSFEQNACVLVTPDVAQATTAVTCTKDLSLESDGRIDLSGLALPEQVLQQLLTAAGIVTFPPEGLVIGRVVNHLGAPLDNVLVSPVPPGGETVTVEYVDATRSSTATGGPTSTDGFFISRNAPFDTRWEATHVGDGRVQAGEFRAGLIADKVSVVVVEMTRP
jgi:hypothetical protein